MVDKGTDGLLGDLKEEDWLVVECESAERGRERYQELTEVRQQKMGVV